MSDDENEYIFFWNISLFRKLKSRFSNRMQFKYFLSQLLLVSKLTEIKGTRVNRRSKEAGSVYISYLHTMYIHRDALKKNFLSYCGSSNRAKPSAFRFLFPRSQYFLLYCEGYEKVKCGSHTIGQSVGRSATLLLVLVSTVIPGLRSPRDPWTSLFILS
jgi:hypothetical protein